LHEEVLRKVSYLLGVDGGGTKTKALIADAEGIIIGQGNGGPANILFDEFKIIRSSIMEAITDALAFAEISGEQVTRGIFGVHVSEDMLSKYLKELLPNCEYYFLEEGLISFASGSDKLHGVALVAGTGSFAWGRDMEGKVVFSGGGGAAFGDEGSGYEIGREALRVIGKMCDGRGRKTLLASKVFNYLGCNSFDGVLSYVYGKQEHRSYRFRIAALAPIVLEAALEKDFLACQIVSDAAAELELLAVSCARKLEFYRDIDVVLTGGVLRHGGPLLDELLGRLKVSMPHNNLIVPKIEPAAGAIALAVHGRFKELI
jgi:N-acetylglucosamine kinase-like BadF-type ATPase